MLVEFCISEINEMLLAAYMHGGDGGGPYGSSPTRMKEAVDSFLIKTGLDKEYWYQEIDRVFEDGKYKLRYPDVPQIVKKPTNERVVYGWS